MIDDIEKLIGAEWSPIDIATLAKGVGSIAAHVAFKKSLWCALEKHRERTGRQYVTKAGHLVLLTDAELARYSRSNAKTAARKERRAISRAACVDLAGLPDGQREAHKKFLERRTRMLAIRELAAAYDDPIDGLQRALVDTRRAAEERINRRASVLQLSAKV